MNKGKKKLEKKEKHISNLENATEKQLETLIKGFSEMTELKIIQTLSSLDWAFKDAITNSQTHGIHPYPAKFIPQLPKVLISALSDPGDVVWDPFGGSGTTAFEALSLNRRAISTDINPIATLVASTKNTCINHKENEEIRNLVQEMIMLLDSKQINERLKREEGKISKLIPPIPNIDKWFHKNAINELAYIRCCIESISNEKVKMIAKTALSKIILKSSYQDGETRYASKPGNVTSGDVIGYFTNELENIRKKVIKNSNILFFRNAEFNTSDIRKESKPATNSIDLVVTSPPYPNSTDYHLYHRFRLFWLGYDPRDIAESEIGSHLRAQRLKTGIDTYVTEMTDCLRVMFNALRPGKYATVIVGSGVYGGVQYETSVLLAQEAKKIGFKIIKTINRSLHDSKRSFIMPGRRLKEEQILILKKPEENITLSLLPAPYKLFPFEKEISKMEKLSLFQESQIKLNSITISPSEIFKLKKLTFIHAFESKSFVKERTWQAILENGDAFEVTTNRKDPKYVTHGLHEYKGKFYPHLAKSIFTLAKLKPGDKVLDPFCGSGTVLLESYLNGFNASGNDINPVALKIARTKTEILKTDPYLFDMLLVEFLDKIESLNFEKYKDIEKSFDEKILPELTSWFPRNVLIKLSGILIQIEKVTDPTIREFLEVCLSSIIRNVSQQDPKDLRIRRRKDELTDAPVVELFIKKISEQKKRIFKFWSLSNTNPSKLGDAHAEIGDARDFEFLSKLSNGKKFDAIVTSPPYATALPYIDTDRLSILVLFGLKAKQRQEIEDSLIGSREISLNDKDLIDKNIEGKSLKEIKSKSACDTISLIYSLNKDADVGFRRKNMAALLYRYYSDMTKAMINMDKVIKDKGSIFFVIGNNKTTAGGKEVDINSSTFLKETAMALGWRLNKKIPITVTQENRLHNKNSIKENDILWFEKN
jgi:DNA modification methylase